MAEKFSEAFLSEPHERLGGRRRLAGRSDAQESVVCSLSRASMVYRRMSRGLRNAQLTAAFLKRAGELLSRPRSGAM